MQIQLNSSLTKVSNNPIDVGDWEYDSGKNVHFCRHITLFTHLLVPAWRHLGRRPSGVHGMLQVPTIEALQFALSIFLAGWTLESQRAEVSYHEPYVWVWSDVVVKEHQLNTTFRIG
jgi:hypothetical protein